MADICTWTGATGNVYSYEIYPIDSSWNPVAANYIFARRSPYATGRWLAVYIGESSNIRERFADHHRAPCIRKEGATHVHVHLNADQGQRLFEETDLIKNISTPCNG